jgi:hypothetical protein
VLVIAGSGRGAGKTAVGCALIAAMPELRWVAVKVSPHEHDTGRELWEELDFHSEKDTGRYLAAGAQRAFLVSGIKDSQAGELLLEARGRSSQCDALLVESNRIAAGIVANLGEPAVSIAVLAGAESEWKASLWAQFGTTDALVLTGGLAYEELPVELQTKPVFRLEDGRWSSPELIEFVRARLLPMGN